jgi:hypothetical protein
VIGNRTETVILIDNYSEKSSNIYQIWMKSNECQWMMNWWNVQPNLNRWLDQDRVSSRIYGRTPNDNNWWLCWLRFEFIWLMVGICWCKINFQSTMRWTKEVTTSFLY